MPMVFNKTSVCPGSVGTNVTHPFLPIRSPAEQSGPDCQPGFEVIQLPLVFLEAEEARVLPEAEESLTTLFFYSFVLHGQTFWLPPLAALSRKSGAFSSCTQAGREKRV